MMQPGFYGQGYPMMGGMPTMGMPFTPGMGMQCTPGMGMPYVPGMGMPQMPGMGMPYMQGMEMGNFPTQFGAFHCPSCGYSGPIWHGGMSPTMNEGYGGYPTWSDNTGLGGLRRHGGAYSPQYAATGLPTDEEIVEMIYDAMDVDPLVPYDAEIDVNCDAGVVTLTGTVPNKRAKHAVGDDAWWAPGVTDVRNEITISGRRRTRTAPRETQETK